MLPIGKGFCIFKNDLHEIQVGLGLFQGAQNMMGLILRRYLLVYYLKLANDFLFEIKGDDQTLYM